jgi:anhydro-N-acetylmuramic acid kinase
LNQIADLYQINQLKERTCIGLMSGTSMDGLDIICCTFRDCGEKLEFEVKGFQTISYTADQKAKIRSVFAREYVHFPELVLLNQWLGELHASMILDTLELWNMYPSDIHFIASHGQTVMHVPSFMHTFPDFRCGTMQIGDGDVIAVRTGIVTLSDFRQKHIAGGGEGAPLAAYGDILFFRDELNARILLNIGGIANFTFLPARVSDQKLMVTDTGPGNTLIDQYCQRYFNISYDMDGIIACRGEIIPELLHRWLSHPFFSQQFPVSTGPETFNLQFIEDSLLNEHEIAYAHEDIVSTLTALTVESIKKGIKSLNLPSAEIYVSGGGFHNKFLLDHLVKSMTEYSFNSIEKLGITADSKEAFLFAAIANHTIAGRNFTKEPLLSGYPVLSFGKISLPG